VYYIFPYRKKKLRNNLLISPTGEFVFCDDSLLAALEAKCELPNDFYIELKSKHFLCAENEVPEETLIHSVRRQTKQGYLEANSILLMVVPTIECNCECVYCQASSKKSHSRENYMKFADLFAFCEFALSLPHQEIKVEFQGGEPTLYTAAIQFIVRFLEKHKERYGKLISYVICTNLLEIDQSFIKFIAKYRIDVSTSLDGDQELHDLNRPARKYKSTYEELKKNLVRFRDRGISPSALLTITQHNINHVEQVIDGYIALGFKSVFIRQLNNYGYAFKNKNIQYSDSDFMECYENGLDYIIRKNLEKSVKIREEWFSILLKKVMSPFLDGFVDIQNPTALARMCLLVNYDGNIFPSDEARMIAEMGDRKFLLGNVAENINYEEMLSSSLDFSKIHSLDEIEECRECPYMIYCGADPVRLYYILSFSGEPFCGKKKRVFDLLFSKIEQASPSELKLFRTWTND
jgi:His-Xaa-Ser system radical SAM maturase HxsB